MFEEHVETIRKTRGKLTYVKHFPIAIPNHVNYSNDYRVEKMIGTFTRYAYRVEYFANNFIRKLSEQEKGPDFIKSESEYLIQIQDDVFFEFDAFVTFTKSIFEGNIVDNANGLSSKAKKYFMKTAKKYKTTFLDNILLPIRNEIVHLNNMGTSIGALAFYSKENKLMSLQSHHKDENGEEMNLISLFSLLFTTVDTIINEILGIFLLNYFETNGTPDKDIIIMTENGKTSLVDFNIPGFYGFKET